MLNPFSISAFCGTKGISSVVMSNIFESILFRYSPTITHLFPARLVQKNPLSYQALDCFDSILEDARRWHFLQTPSFVIEDIYRTILRNLCVFSPAKLQSLIINEIPIYLALTFFHDASLLIYLASL